MLQWDDGQGGHLARSAKNRLSFNRNELGKTAERLALWRGAQRPTSGKKSDDRAEAGILSVFAIKDAEACHQQGRRSDESEVPR